MAAYAEADVVMLGMPLYTDAMPAIVKSWIERLEPRVGVSGNPPIGFLVQSGFMEALHSRPLERYLAKLAKRLGGGYAGTIVRGEGEALQVMPDEASAKLWTQLELLGGQLAGAGVFETDTLKRVAGLERMSPAVAAVASLAVSSPSPRCTGTARSRRTGPGTGASQRRMPRSARGNGAETPEG